MVIKADVHGLGGSHRRLAGEDRHRRGARADHPVGAGAISESDVMLAKGPARRSSASTSASAQARALAEREGVEIRYYAIIYDLLDDIKGVLSGMLAPIQRETFLGNAEVLQVFDISKVGKIAGCRVTEGVVREGASRCGSSARTWWCSNSAPCRRSSASGTRSTRWSQGRSAACDFGFQDIKEGDTIECFTVETIQRTLWVSGGKANSLPSAAFRELDDLMRRIALVLSLAPGRRRMRDHCPSWTRPTTSTPFLVAVRDGDRAGFENHLDRAALKTQLRSRVIAEGPALVGGDPRVGSLGALLAGPLVDVAVDALVQPEVFRAIAIQHGYQPGQPRSWRHHHLARPDPDGRRPRLRRRQGPMPAGLRQRGRRLAARRLCEGDVRGLSRRAPPSSGLPPPSSLKPRRFPRTRAFDPRAGTGACSHETPPAVAGRRLPAPNPPDPPNANSAPANWFATPWPRSCARPRSRTRPCTASRSPSPRCG